MPRVPDDLQANTAHPFWRLLRIVEAARAVVRAVRRFFPVDDRPWEFAESPRARLISGEGPRLYELEEMLNADRYPFADRQRNDPGPAGLEQAEGEVRHHEPPHDRGLLPDLNGVTQAARRPVR
jgi:hypothetical protein